ncbi:MAG TPA: ribosome maturation factor RimP [Bacteroidota bacterium]|nr:ribosome maturation factor RimP [Bacteroidota bacterium]
MTDIVTKIAELARPMLDRQGAFQVDLAVRSDRGRKIVQVLADTDEGITISQCAEISRELGKALDEADVIQGAYDVEVSSPGLERPLRLLRQYRKNVGRTFRVRYAEGSDVVELVAPLTDVDGNRLTFTRPEMSPITLTFDAILESKEVLPW